MSNKDKINCYQDLQRAAVSLYLNPEGKNHFVFINHAIKILEGVNKNIADSLEKIKDNISPANNKNIADKLLTIGVMLKGEI